MYHPSIKFRAQGYVTASYGDNTTTRNNSYRRTIHPYFHTILGAQSQYLQYISRLAKPSGGVLGSDGPYRAVEEVVYLEDVHAMRHRVAHDPALATNVGLDLREGRLDRVEVW